MEKNIDSKKKKKEASHSFSCRVCCIYLLLGCSPLPIWEVVLPFHELTVVKKKTPKKHGLKEDVLLRRCIAQNVQTTRQQLFCLVAAPVYSLKPVLYLIYQAKC